MPKSEVHICECPHCQQESAHADQELHQEMNLLLSRLDEQQRRWYVAVESKRMGAGGDRLLSQITGLDEKTRKPRARRTGRFPGRATSQASPSPRRGTPARRKKDVELEPSLERVVEPETAGDPMSEQKWVREPLAPLEQASGRSGTSGESADGGKAAASIGLLVAGE